MAVLIALEHDWWPKAFVANGCQEYFFAWRSKGDCVYASSTGIYMSATTSLQTEKDFIWAQTARRAWFDKFRSAIITANFHQSPNDNSLFNRRTSRSCTILLIYVYDMIISGNNAAGISSLKSHLMNSFKMKDVGPLTNFLGLEVSRNKDGIRVVQTKYADDLHKSARRGDAKTFAKPIELYVKFSKDDGPPLEDQT